MPVITRLRCFFLSSASLIFAISLAAASAVAQGRPPGGMFYPPEELNVGTSQLGALRGNQKEWAVAGRVMNLEGDLIGHAKVSVSPVQAGNYRILHTDPSGDFQTFYFLTQTYITNLEVWLTVSKRGFHAAHELIHCGAYKTPVRLPITLLPIEGDSSLVSRQELVSHLAPELRSLRPSDGISSKSEKEYAKGVRAFIGKDQPARSLESFYDVAAKNPPCAKCRTMLALAELDSGNWDGAARNADVAIRSSLKNTPAASPEALVMGGVMESWLHHPRSAAGLLRNASVRMPKNPFVLQELGRAELHLAQYKEADADLTKALAAGAGPDARLMKVQALLGENNLGAAKAEMARYLDGRPIKKMPMDVRQVWDALQNQKEIWTIYGTPRNVESRSRHYVDYLDYSAAQIQGLVPAKSQLPLKAILSEVGKNVATQFRDFRSTTSLEIIRQEKIDKRGRIKDYRDGKYHYLCLMPTTNSLPAFDEYRQSIEQSSGSLNSLDEGYMLTSGFAGAALVFHPAYQAQSNFRYLGRQTIDGHETYVVAFAQDPMRSEMVGMFNFSGQSVYIFVQGLAWIDAQNYQIIRLWTDLLKPLSAVRLKQETTRIQYQQVHFKEIAQAFWLPKTVTVTVDWKGKMLRNLHQYSDYRLFHVGTQQRIHEPKVPKTSSQPKN